MATIPTIIKKVFFTGTAIYISDDFVDIVKARRTLKGIDVFFLQRYPLLKSIKDTPYSDAQEELESIFDKAFPNEADIPYRVAVNLRNASVILRYFTLKGVPQNEVKGAISFEAQKYVPYAIDDLVYSFRTYMTTHDSSEVIFAAAEKKDVRLITEYYGERKMLPSIVEAAPILMARALTLGDSIKKDDAYVSIHFEPPNKAMITGIYRRHPHFFREISIFPGDEEFKTSELGYMPLRDAWPIIERDVVGGVEYMKKVTKKEIEKIFISGFSFFSDENNISGEFGIPFERTRLSFAKDGNIENEDRYLPALALIYDCLNQPLLNLAFDETIRKDLWALKGVFRKSAAAMTVIIAIHLLLQPVYSARRHKIAELKKEFAAYKTVGADISPADIRRYKESIEQKAMLIDNIITRRLSLVEKLGRLGDDIGANAWLNEAEYMSTLEEKPKTFFNLRGAIYAGAETGAASANAMVQSLKRDDIMMRGFKEAEMASIKKAKFLDGDINEFEIVLK